MSLFLAYLLLLRTLIISEFLPGNFQFEENILIIIIFYWYTKMALKAITTAAFYMTNSIYPQ